MRVIAGLFMAALLSACASDPQTPTADDTAFELPADNVSFYATQTLTAGGVRRSQVEADTIFSYEATRRHEFRNAKVNFFQDDGQSAGTLTSNTAEYDVTAGLFVARGNVVLVTPSPKGGERRLETEELFFDVPNDRLWSDRPSTLIEDGQTTHVTLFKANSKFSTWEASGVQTQGSAEGGIRF